MVKSVALGVIISIFIFKSKFAVEFSKTNIKTIYWIVGIIFCIVNGIECYGSWITSSKLPAILGMTNQVYSNFLIYLVSVVSLVAVPIVATCFSYYLEIGKEIFNEFHRSETLKSNTYSFRKSFLVVIGIYLVGISAIIRTGLSYNDDLSRAALGYKNWVNYKRILSNLLSTIVHMDTYLTDVSPLTQIISASIMAFSGVILLVIIYERTQFGLMELLAIIPLYLNPYFLECISYKYDSPYMALSVFGGIFPLLYRKRDLFTYISVSALGTLITCLTYQASSGIYPMLVVLLLLRMWCNREKYQKLIKFCGSSFIGYGVGILIFKFFIMTPTKEGIYVSNALPKINEFFPNIYENLKKYYEYVLTDFKVWWLWIILALIIGFIMTMMNKTEQNRILTGLIATITILFMGILCFGMYPALVQPLFAPRAMYGFCVCLTFLAVCVMENMEKVSFFNISVLILGWTFFVFTFTYGNALAYQKEYMEFRINLVINDINDLELYADGSEVIVQIKGNIGLSPIIESMPQNYQILNRLVPREFSETWVGGLKFYYYYDSNFISNSDYYRDIDIDLTTYNLPMLVDGRYHTIYGNDSYMLIELK
jgi:hypothetical protein